MNAKLEDIIRKTVIFGGYVTVEMLTSYIPDSERNIRRLLEDLCGEKLLRKLDLGQSRKDGNVYQVTRKACVMYGRGDSHIRRKHSPIFRSRSLLRSRFLFSRADDIGAEIISFSAEKKAWFTSRDIKDSNMPKKYNTGVPIVQVEEMLLTGVPYAAPGGVCFLCPDKEESPPYPQIKAALERNADIVREAYFPISFLFVCRDSLKAMYYEKAFVATKRYGKERLTVAAVDTQERNRSVRYSELTVTSSDTKKVL